MKAAERVSTGGFQADHVPWELEKCLEFVDWVDLFGFLLG